MFKELNDFVISHWIEWELGPKPKEISLIRRTSTWLGNAGKVVFYVFPRGEEFPVLIAKTVSRAESGNTILKESKNSQYIWDSLSKDLRQTIPRPLGIYTINHLPVYFEIAFPGTALPDKVASYWFNMPKKRLIIKAIERISWWLSMFQTEIGVKTICLQDGDIHSLFLQPIEAFEQKSIFPKEERKALRELKDIAWSLEGKNISLVPVHGDFWGGSILWGIDATLKVIDWEFFEPAGLPLQDYLNFAIHPGFWIPGKRKYDLLGEFMNLFEDHYYSKIIRTYLWKQAKNSGLDSINNLRFFMALTLIRLSLDRDNESLVDLKNSWRSLFCYFVKEQRHCRAIV